MQISADICLPQLRMLRACCWASERVEWILL